MESINETPTKPRTPVTAADIDKRVRAMLTAFYGYHQGPSPRVGARVRCRGMLGHVVAHDVGDRVYIRLDNGRKAQQKRHETVVIGPRKPLHEALELFASAALDSHDSIAVTQLISHFRGDNGARYANRRSFLWCVHALCHVLAVEDDTTHVVAWLNTQLEAERDLDQLPAPVDAELLSHCTAGQIGHDGLDGLRTIAHHSIRRALELGKASIDMAATDVVQGSQEGDLARCLATDLQTERQMVMIGRSAVNQATGHVDVIDMDTLWSFTRHVSGLEVSENKLDPGWFWDVVTQSASKHPTNVAAMWFADSLIGPDGAEVDVPERRRVAAIGALIALRYAVGNGSASVVKRLIKQAKEQARSLGKNEFSRLAALAPELVAPSTKASIRLSKVDTLAPAMREAVSQLLVLLPPPEVQPPSPSPLKTQNVALADPLPQTQSTTPAPRHEKIRFTRTAQPLRFNVTDHPLLAMEWQLVEEPGAHSAAVATTLEWLEQRLGTSLPKTWNEGAHEIERAGVTVQIESADNLFAFRMEHPDTDHPTRWWRVEATVLSGRRHIGGMVGVRMQVRDFVDLPPPHPSIPALVRAWAVTPGLLLAGSRGGRVTHIGSNDDFGRIIRIIGRDNRETPVLVTAAGGVRLPQQGPLAGLARMIVVSPTVQAYETIYGKLSPDTVHVYPPRIKRPEVITATGDRWQEQLRTRIMALRQNPETPSFREVRDTIHAHRLQRLNTALQAAAAREAPDSTAPLLDQHVAANAPAEAEQAEQSRMRPPAEVEGDTDQVPELSVADIRQLVRREVRDYEELLEVAELERDDALSARDQANSEVMALRHYVEQLQARLSANLPATSPEPQSLDGLRDWAPSVTPRIVFADKALRNAADCAHNEVSKIIASLRALHDLYWPMRFSTNEDVRERAHTEWVEFLQLQRLRWTPVGKAAHTGRYQDEYRATIEGISYVSSMHVAGNSTTDPLRCLRIYVDVDEDRERIVVIHLPTHLTNTLT